MSDPREQERWLACGRPASALVDLVAEPERADPELAEHARGCRYCGSELAALQRQWNAVRQAAATPVNPPDGLVSRALETVRGIRGGGSEPLELAQPGGRLRIGDRPLLLLVRQEAIDLLRDWPGVHLRGLSGGDRRVELAVAVGYGRDAAALAESLRAEVAERLAASLGAAAPELSVRVVDVIE